MVTRELRLTIREGMIFKSRLAGFPNLFAGLACMGAATLSGIKYLDVWSRTLAYMTAAPWLIESSTWIYGHVWSYMAMTLRNEGGRQHVAQDGLLSLALSLLRTLLDAGKHRVYSPGKRRPCTCSCARQHAHYVRPACPRTCAHAWRDL